MDTKITEKKCLIFLAIPIFIALIIFMVALSSIFFKIYLKTAAHFLGVSHFLGISEQNTFSITALLLLTALFGFVVIRHNIKDSLITFLLFIASYGVYGYLFATFHALGSFAKPLLPSIFLCAFLACIPIIKKIKLVLDNHHITPGVQNLLEGCLWTGIFLVSSKSFYPKAYKDLVVFPFYVFAQKNWHLSEASIFFLFFVICLSALVALVIIQSSKFKPLLQCNKKTKKAVL